MCFRFLDSEVIDSILITSQFNDTHDDYSIRCDFALFVHDVTVIPISILVLRVDILQHPHEDDSNSQQNV